MVSIDLSAGLVPFLPIAIAVIAYLLLQELRRIATALTTPTPTPSPPSPRPSPRPADALREEETRHSKRHVKEPPVFPGEPDLFREWVFSIDLALKAIRFATSEEEVTYASSFLVGNARLWLISNLEAGEHYTSWPALRHALGSVYGPHYSDEQNRLNLFGVRQQGNIEAYITVFNRLSLQVPELDEHSRALMFVNGLRGNVKREVLKEHPTTLSKAIQAALTVAAESRHQPVSTDSPNYIRRPTRLSSEDRNRLMNVGGCFACRQRGHLARDCPRVQHHPNAGRQ